MFEWGTLHAPIRIHPDVSGICRFQNADSSSAGHSKNLSIIWASALSLLVLGIFTDDPDLSLSLNDFALIADRFYRRSYFHFSSSFTAFYCIFLRLSENSAIYILTPKVLKFNKNYLSLQMIRPFDRSYGDISSVTLSPGRIRMKFIRSLPLMCAITSWSFSSLTRNIALGSFSTTVPSSSITSAFDIQFLR